MSWLTALAVSSGIAAASPTEPSSIDQVIAAERAFAAETRKLGFKRGFLAYVAEDGFMFGPGPIPAKPGLEALPEDHPDRPVLDWWPELAGVAASGDLGFTTGGASIPVRYFTVWQRQPDGAWRWIYDGGPRLAVAMARPGKDNVARLARATAAAGSPERALAEIAPIEADIARTATSDAAAARRPHLVEESLVAGSLYPGGTGALHQETELARQPRQQAHRPIGGIASRAGDFAFTWGETRWREAAQARWGHYARIWQKRTEGWRLVADIMVSAPGSPPA